MDVISTNVVKRQGKSDSRCLLRTSDEITLDEVEQIRI